MYTYYNGTLTNVLPHKNAADTVHDIPPRHDTLMTVYRHRADLSLCYPFMWSVTVEYTNTNFNVLGKIPIWKSFPDRPHPPANSQLYDANMVVVCRKLGRKCTVPCGA